MDRDLLLLVQGEVRGLIKDYNTFEKYLATLRDQDKRKGTALDEHHKRLEALEEKLQEESENRSKEITKVLESGVFRSTVIDTTSSVGRKSRATRANSDEDR